MELLLTTPPAQPATAEAEKDTSGDQFSFEEFFDFSNEEEDVEQLLSDNTSNAANVFQSITAESDSLLAADSSSNSSIADFGSSILTSDLCLPYDDLAELEWVSTFAEESFSSEDMEKLNFISGMSSTRPEQQLIPEDTRPDPVIVPGKARSKRPRVATGSWNSPLLLTSTLEPDTDLKPMKKPKIIRSYVAQCLPVADGRRCLHCQTDNTPQWRTGPMGPKTLCNACGVRYKSGRLVPEYRPASSPTFVQTEHSNSHRKVLELRKKKETSSSSNIMGVGAHHHLHDHRYLKQYRVVSYDGSDGEDYLIHRPGFGELI